MAKEPLNIELFDKGLVTSADPEDIDINAMSYSENLDANVDGKLQGIPDRIAQSLTMGINYVRGGFLRRITGEYDLVYTDGANIKVIKDFYGTPSESTVISGSVGYAFIKQNRAVYIGCGNDSSHLTQWVGYTDYSQFGGLSQLVFAGAGLNDCTIRGSYTGSTNASTYYVKISATGVTDSFQWKKDSGSWSSSILMSSTDFQLIAEGLYLSFNAVTGHTLSDQWSMVVNTSTNILQTYNAQLSTYEGTSNGHFLIGSTAGGGAGAYLHRYKYSISYEGSNESPLSVTYVDTLYSSNTVFNLDDIYVLAHNGANSPLSFDARITSINVYVAVSADTTADNLGLFSLAYSIPFNNNLVNGTLAGNLNPSFLPSTGTTLANTGADMLANLTYNFIPGQTYEAITGVPENADPVILNYKLGCELGGYAFVCNAYESNLPNSGMMLFKSKAGAYGVFDIVNDKLYLNFFPVAMRPFNSKLYIWDTHNMYIINPDGMYIEDTVPGVGCISDSSLVVIDIEESHALFWADVNNIYMTTGQGIIPIGNAIYKKVNSNGVDWQSMSHSNTILFYDSVKQLVICSDSLVANTDNQAFAYHLLKKRWDYFPNFVESSAYMHGSFTGIKGESYSSNSYGLFNNFGGATNRAWTYISKEINNGSPSQKKIYYDLYLDGGGTGTITPYYSIDKGSTYRGLTNAVQVLDSLGNWQATSTIRLKITGGAGSSYVDSLSLLFRRMIGVR